VSRTSTSTRCGLVSAVLAAFASLCACSGAQRGERVLDELERMTFVAPGRCDLAGHPREVRGVDLVEELRVDEPLLVDRFEATRADWRHHFGAYPEREDLEDALATTEGDPSRAAWPAYCDFEEALAFAAQREMRLLTAGEWVFVAAGPTFQRYPWGDVSRRSVANTLELGLLRPLPVGTFESGLSTSGCYDLYGNVMEWVVGALPPSAAVEWSGVQQASAMGGTYLNALQPIFTPSEGAPFGASGFHGLPMPPGTRAVDIGVRCAIEAERFLLGRASVIERSAVARRRLAEIGRRWGRASVPLLERLVQRDESLFVPQALLEGARE
jgi:Sulfatase-modifying factor enzyme 1